jgi:hypothetical protein
MSFKTLILGILTIFALASCGGGGGGSSTPSNAQEAQDTAPIAQETDPDEDDVSHVI